GSPQKAIDDYATAIELFGNKDRISSVGYLGMARSYEKIGRFCDAALVIESWVSLNPARNESSQTRAIIATYMKQGGCERPRRVAMRSSRFRDRATRSSCRLRSMARAASSSSIPAPRS